MHSDAHVIDVVFDILKFCLTRSMSVWNRRTACWGRKSSFWLRNSNA